MIFLYEDWMFVTGFLFAGFARRQIADSLPKAALQTLSAGFALQISSGLEKAGDFLRLLIWLNCGVPELFNMGSAESGIDRRHVSAADGIRRVALDQQRI